jgi:ketosteroid isomerase-like protein
MSEENVEVVRRLTGLIREDDLAAAWTAAAEVLHPEIEMDTTRVPAPGLDRICKGPDEVARWWLDWLEAWGSLGRFEDPEIIDSGDQVFHWITQHELRGKGSGVEVKMPEYGWVVTVRDQQVVRATLYMDKAEALEAAGLSE